MSMFSTHYIIRSPRWGYWIGGPPHVATSWSKISYDDYPIRIFAQADAYKLCDRLFKGIETIIEEGE